MEFRRVTLEICILSLCLPLLLCVLVSYSANTQMVCWYLNLIFFLSGFVNQITRHKWAWPFMQPVDVEGLGLDDYYEVKFISLNSYDVHCIDLCELL